MRPSLASPLAHIAPHRFLLSSQLRQFHVPAPPISVLAPQLAINHTPFICAPVPPIVPCPTHTSSLPAAARSPSPLARKDRTQPINSCSRVEPHDSTRPSPTSSTRSSHRTQVCLSKHPPHSNSTPLHVALPFPHLHPTHTSSLPCPCRCSLPLPSHSQGSRLRPVYLLHPRPRTQVDSRAAPLYVFTHTNVASFSSPPPCTSSHTPTSPPSPHTSPVYTHHTPPLSPRIHPHPLLHLSL